MKNFQKLTVTFLFVFFIYTPNAFSLSPVCADFSNFPATLPQPSPVVAPPGYSIPSDFNLELSNDYAFIDYSSGFYLYTGTVLGDSGTLKVSINNPTYSGKVTLHLIHFNQPEIEFKIDGTNGAPITPGWVTTNEFPFFDPIVYPIPNTNEAYVINIDASSHPNAPISVIEFRNLSNKFGVIAVCIE